MKLVSGQVGAAAPSRAEETDKREVVVLQEKHTLAELHAQLYQIHEVAAQVLVQVRFYVARPIL